MIRRIPSRNLSLALAGAVMAALTLVTASPAAAKLTPGLGLSFIPSSTVSVNQPIQAQLLLRGSGATPTGHIDFSLFPNGTCAGTPTNTDTVQANQSTNPATYVDPMSYFFATAGVRSFQATYSGDGTYNSLSTCQSFTVVNQADLIVSKTCGSAPVVPGQTVSCDIVVVNSGGADAQSVRVTDTLPTGATAVSAGGGGFSCTNGTPVTTCDLATLGAHQRATITVTYTVNDDVTSGTVLTNRASATTTTPEADATNNAASASVTVLRADVTVSKSCTPNPAVPGGNVSCSIIVVNNGPADANIVLVTDVVPSGTTAVSAGGGGFTCNVSTPTTLCGLGGSGILVGHQSATLMAVYTVDANTATGTSLTNTATVFTGTPETDTTNNTATATVTVQRADVTVSKSCAPTSVVPGQNVTCQVVVANSGLADAQNVSVADTLPSGATAVSAVTTAGQDFTCSSLNTCTRATLGAGQTATITFVYSVDATVASGTVITDTASVTTTTPETDITNNSATASVTVLRADLAVSKTCAPSPVIPGQNVTCHIVVANNGPADAQNVSLVDTLPAGTTAVSVAGGTFSCTLGTPTTTCTQTTLAAGQSATITAVYNVNANVPSGTTLTNLAQTATTTPEITTANNSASADVLVARADLAISKACSPDPVVPSADVTCQISVTNLGPTDAQSVSVTDVIPTGTTATSLASTAGPTFTCTLATLTCARPMLAAGATTTITAVLHVSDNAGPSTPLTDVATASTTTPETTLANNTGTATVTTVACTITGTAGPDIIMAAKGNQVICGGGGDDYIVAKGTNNVIFGEGGNDIITGGSGNDVILGGAGDDSINGNGGTDRLFGNAGNDTINAEDRAGGDIVDGGPGSADTCRADSGDAVFDCEL